MGWIIFDILVLILYIVTGIAIYKKGNKVYFFIQDISMFFSMRIKRKEISFFDHAMACSIGFVAFILVLIFHTKMYLLRVEYLEALTKLRGN